MNKPLSRRHGRYAKYWQLLPALGITINNDLLQNLQQAAFRLTSDNSIYLDIVKLVAVEKPG